MKMHLNRMSPGITDMIRMDHTHVFAVFHRFKHSTSHARKRALVRNACLAIDVHAQLEEEIFYPELRDAAGADPVLDRSGPEHNEMRALMQQLRSMTPDDPAYDRTFHALMRTVIHHVADEESVLLPEAERRMSPERLNELGAEMTKRRIELVRPHARELASTSVQSFPVMSMLAATSALTLGAWLLRRNGTHRTPPRRAWSIP